MISAYVDYQEMRGKPKRYIILRLKTSQVTVLVSYLGWVKSSKVITSPCGKVAADIVIPENRDSFF